MIPTPKLRFVKRTLNAGEAAKQNLPAYHTLRILQQWWEVAFHDDSKNEYVTYGEWRDVPTEEETQ